MRRHRRYGQKLYTDYWTKKVSGVKRRRVNMSHLMPLQDKVDVKRGASDDEVAQALQAAGKTEFMKA
jgi:large subunit ribosomal protein L14e